LSEAQEHLTIEQIERLIEVQSAETLSSDDAALLEQSRRHLACCQVCSEVFSMHDEFTKDLNNLKLVRRPQFDKDCPTQKEILELASGALKADRSDELLRHVASCDFCGPFLMQALEDFDEHLNPEEIAQLASLQSGRNIWQENLAAKLIAANQNPTNWHRFGPVSRKPLTDFLGWRKWILAGTAIFLVTIFSWWLLHDRELRHVNSLLVQAYSENRNLELRLSGAAYAPLKVARGSEKSRLDVPQSLLQAEATIAGRHGGTQQVDWLVARARADILEWNYEAAIRTLLEAQARAPDTSKIKIDLATAYFERAQSTGYVADFGAAAEMIGRVLDKDPDNAVALFNRALIYERLSLYSEAEADWKRYLSLDPSGDWSREAREHLARVDQKLNEKKKGADAVDLLSPEIVAADTVTSVSDDFLDMRIEEYQRTALKKWTPELIKPALDSELNRTARFQIAIDRISNLMIRRHGDVFLQELRLTAQKPLDLRFKRPLATLALAISANEFGHEQEAMQFAQEAEKGFDETGNIAGVVAARFERAYALQFLSQVASCQRVAESVAKDSHKYGYKWLEAQALVEWGFCANMAGNLALASRRLGEATGVAKEARYEESLERAMVGEAVMQWQTGSMLLAWNLTLEGLQRFWDHPVSDVRAISLYAVLDLVSEETQQWHLQEAVLKESISLVDRGADQLAAAQTHSRLAGCELMLNHYEQAESNLQQSLRLFRSAPSTNATFAQELTVSVNQAKTEMQSRQFKKSWERLHSLEPIITNLHDNLSRLDFYGTLGEVYRNLGRQADAEFADRKAIKIFQSSLEGLDEPRDRLAWFHEASFAYRSLVQLKLNEKDPLGALQAWEAYHNSLTPSFRSKSLGAMAIEKHRLGRTPPIAPTAGGAEKVLVYAKLPDGMFVWNRIGDRVEVAQIQDSWDDIQRLQEIFIQECSTPFSDLTSTIEHGRQLYRKLLFPFSETFSAGDTIVIEPDEELADLPMGALVDETGQYFGANHSVIMSTGSGKGHKRPTRAVSSRDSILLVIASGDQNKEQVRDPLAEDEVKSVGSLFQNPVIIGPSSPPSRGFWELLTNASIFHYAGHSGTSVRGGELSIPSRYEKQGGEEVSVRSEDIAKRKFPRGQLVVLSACETNRGQAGRWLDRENLALAFLNAGVPEVVASQWRVDSNATTSLMREFYSQVLKGEAAPDALRMAVAKTRSLAEFSHPYYWAAFSVLA
jgi:CHAT domain-containing protein